MNRFTLTIFLACLLAMPLAQAADEEDHAAHHPGADQGQAAPAPDDKAAGMKMEKMQEQMKTMQDQMEKIHSAKDPQERQKLMREHMQSMREGMKMMKGMGGDMKMGMMGGKKKGAATGAAEPEHGQDGAGQAMAQGGDQMSDCMKMMEGMMGGGMMMKKRKMMEDRIDMMQQMMEQMMEHESAEQEMERDR
jgi:hypothetical protein